MAAVPARAFDQTTIFGDAIRVLAVEPPGMSEDVRDLVAALRLVERQTPIVLALEGLTDREWSYVLFLARRVAARLSAAAAGGGLP